MDFRFEKRMDHMTRKYEPLLIRYRIWYIAVLLPLSVHFLPPTLHTLNTENERVFTEKERYNVKADGVNERV